MTEEGERRCDALQCDAILLPVCGWLTNSSLPLSDSPVSPPCSSGRGCVRATAGPVYEHNEAQHRRLRDAADQDLWQ